MEILLVWNEMVYKYKGIVGSSYANLYDAFFLESESKEKFKVSGECADMYRLCAVSACDSLVTELCSGDALGSIRDLYESVSAGTVTKNNAMLSLVKGVVQVYLNDVLRNAESIRFGGNLAMVNGLLARASSGIILDPDMTLHKALYPTVTSSTHGEYKKLYNGIYYTDDARIVAKFLDLLVVNFFTTHRFYVLNEEM